MTTVHEFDIIRKQTAISQVVNAARLGVTSMSSEQTSSVKFQEPQSNSVFLKLNPLKEEQEGKEHYRQLQIGDAIEGTLVESRVNKFQKQEYVIRPFDGTKDLVLAQAGNLTFRLKEKNINIGDAVRITYNGKNPMQSGQFKGTMAHNFSVQGEAV